MVSVPPKTSISMRIGILKNKITLIFYKSYAKLIKKLYCRFHFWAVGYFVCIVGLDE
ncbi:transposase [Arenibacter certesii]|uniref:transposase n=1 Tax=Arenibacter certesii TaxID=228955 RepID=UPI00146FB9AB